MTTLPWDTAPHLPWQMFMNPAEQWATLPTFLIGEYVIIACALIGLYHARRAGRANLLIWLAALIAGTCNDLIFMALPLVDNFWQAQSSIMLTPRLPLYILCIYVVFMYWPAVAVRRLGLGRWSTAALTGLVACMFYAPYDIVGAKFLWWTWHDSDASLAARLLGTPVSSSLWVLTFVGSFALLLDVVLRDRKVTGQSFTGGFALVASLTTAMMMMQITILQAINGGTPRYLALCIGLVTYGTVAFLGRRAVSRSELSVDWPGRRSHRRLPAHARFQHDLLRTRDPREHGTAPAARPLATWKPQILPAPRASSSCVWTTTKKTSPSPAPRRPRMGRSGTRSAAKHTPTTRCTPPGWAGLHSRESWYSHCCLVPSGAYPFPSRIEIEIVHAQSLPPSVSGLNLISLSN